METKQIVRVDKDGNKQLWTQYIKDGPKRKMIMELFVEVDGVKTHFPMYDGETMEDVDKRIDDYRIRRRKRTFIAKRLDEIECKDEFYRDCALMWDEYFEKSYQVLLDNPNITLEEFLKQTGIDKL